MGAYAFTLSACNWLYDSNVSVDEKNDVCADYCEIIDENCVDDNRQYRTAEQCLAVCDTFEIGKKSDEEGNTVHCRSHFAEEAEENPNTHCTSAGPGGDEVCGGNCESFCNIQTTICDGDNRQYPTTTECITECEDFDLSEPFFSGIEAGDTFACRLAQLILATASPEAHCPNIAVDSPVCQ